MARESLIIRLINRLNPSFDRWCMDHHIYTVVDPVFDERFERGFIGVIIKQSRYSRTGHTGIGIPALNPDGLMVVIFKVDDFNDALMFTWQRDGIMKHFADPLVIKRGE